MSDIGGRFAGAGGDSQLASTPPAGPGKFLKLLLLLLTGVDFALVFVLYQQITAQAGKSNTDLIIIGGLIVAVITTSAVIIKAYSGLYSTPSVIIPADDRQLLEDLIRGEKSKGVELYIQVASLKGPTRAATALGLTGLPLATIGLTIFFSLLAIAPFVKDSSNFLDLAKLTLGAFIGSFVQRSNEAIDRAVRGGNANKPDGGTATSGPAAPAPPGSENKDAPAGAGGPPAPAVQQAENHP